MQEISTNSNPEVRARRSRESFNPNEEMGFIQAIKNVFVNFADFSGRARRSEYWFFRLFNFLVIFTVFILATPFVMNNEEEGAIILVLLLILYFLIAIIPGIAVTVRRLHDTGKSGVNILLGFIPIVGPILMLVYLTTDSENRTNRWGRNPKIDPKQLNTDGDVFS